VGRRKMFITRAIVANSFSSCSTFSAPSQDLLWVKLTPENRKQNGGFSCDVQ
jgi:hypothetical protein